MDFIGNSLTVLDHSQREFVVEALSSALPPAWVEDALARHGRESFRRRKLPAPFVLWFVILMGLFRRTSYVNLLEKLRGGWWAEEHWGSGSSPSSSAITKARDRLGVEPLRDLYEHSASEWAAQSTGFVVHGMRVFAVDGSTFKVPDSPENRQHFGKPGAYRGETAYPQLRWVGLMDVGTRMFRSVRFGGYHVSEQALARELLPFVAPGSLLLFDRNFVAYDFLWDLSTSPKAEFVLRVRKNNKCRVVRKLGRGDSIVEVDIPRYFRRRRPDMPRTWRLREVVYRHPRGEKDIRIFTTLLDDKQISTEEIASLYNDRWEEETAIDEIKTHLCDCTQVNRPVVFRSQKPMRIEQELYGLFIAYNAVRFTMWRASCEKDSIPRRLSFTTALERIRETVCEMMRLRTALLPDRFDQMLTAIRRVVVPARPGRSEPRAVKIKMSRYRLKKPKKKRPAA